MDSVRLRPFDFAQAAARAGLQPNGQPLAPARADGLEGGFAAAQAPPASRRYLSTGSSLGPRASDWRRTIS